MDKINIFWFRRDLRVNDNAGLYHALNSGLPIVPIFIFDTNILERLDNKEDARVGFIHATISALKEELKTFDCDLKIFHGFPLVIWKNIIQEYNIDSVIYNHDYEPYAKERDDAVGSLLDLNSVTYYSYKDHVIFEKDEVLKDDGKPYTVFTPYKKKWLSKLTEKSDIAQSFYLKSYPSDLKLSNLYKTKEWTRMISLNDLGFKKSSISISSLDVKQSIIKEYDQNRDFPSLYGTSRLGIHFRFGTISIREKALKASFLNQTYLSELIWRDFYAMILSHFPHVVNGAFRPEYDHIQWLNNESDFRLWCVGKTGYPIVDAGMRELYKTGFMHNRVRMITASFLTKHLLIDWRWGEAWFAKHLLDYDLASNNGGWQWAAGCGTDAAPYFRIFSPDAQTERFDKDKSYIKKWIPEYGTSKYPKPIIDHKLARERCLKVYKDGLSSRFS